MTWDRSKVLKVLLALKVHKVYKEQLVVKEYRVY
jgi:hypothetical protein